MSALPNRGFPAFLLALLFATNSFTQQQTPNQARPDDDVVRITSNLVQVDAVITDDKGHRVTDLKPSEVQIFEDNRSQKITHFSYIIGEGERLVSPVKPSENVNRAVTPPPNRLRPEDVRRTIVVVVDDLGLSFQSISLVRRALRKFVSEQLQQGDLVAIVRTSGGVGALQQFTSDPRQLLTAIDNVKYYAGGRAGVSPFASIKAPTPGKFGPDLDAKTAEQDEFRDDMFAVGTLGTVGYVMRGLADLPGRKSIVLVSEGFKIERREFPNRATELERLGRNDRAFFRLLQIIDQASRASVVVHTLNPAGVQALSSITAEDALADRAGDGLQAVDRINQSLGDRRDNARDLQSGLDYLAEQTGGLSIRNNNDIGAGLRKILDDQNGFYLIGYRPDALTFDPKTGRRTFHHLTLKVTRPGKFNVRMRDGFFGATNTASTPSEAITREQLVRALTSPFGSAGVPIRLTSLFANDATAGSYMRSLLHVDGSALTFTEEPEGWRQAQFEVVAVTFGDNGNVVDEISRVDRLRVRDEAYQRVLKSGFVYLMTLPIKKPGGYQLRIALRDQASAKVGSASQFVQVPDVKKGHLALSGIMLGARQPGGASSAPGNSDEPARAAAIRQFHSGETLRYNFVIYNARSDKASNQTHLQTQVRLFRAGQEVFTGRLQLFALNNPPDIARLSAESSIQLGADMPPGEYVLQVIAIDALADEKYRTATQWIDFEIVK
jgi:VWFA-related protein